jgi:formylglycine-generating enzyme required for sulfatase activity
MTAMRRWTSLSFFASCGLLVLAAAPGPTAQTATATAERYQESIPGTLVEFEMVMVPGGRASFSDGETDLAADVGPFYIGRTEVTWDMYDVFALGLDEPAEGSAGSDAIARPSNPYGAPDYGWGHAGFPVMSVTRHAAETFCAWLSDKTGRTYRLPTEAEWMRAAVLASGDAALSADRLSELAWHDANSERQTHAVGTRAPDALGLFDLFGNTAEWVITSNGDLVTRGGSFREAVDAIGPDARAKQTFMWNERDPQLPKSQWWLSDGPFVGFRLVSSPQGEQR